MGVLSPSRHVFPRKGQTRARMEERNRALEAPPTFQQLQQDHSPPRQQTLEGFSQPGVGRYSVPKKLPALGELVLPIQSGLDRHGTESKWWRLSTKYLGCNGPRTVPSWCQNPRGLAGTKDRWPEGDSQEMWQWEESDQSHASLDCSPRQGEDGAAGGRSTTATSLSSVKHHSHLNRMAVLLLSRKLYLGLCYSAQPKNAHTLQRWLSLSRHRSLSKATVRILTIRKRGRWE